MIVDNKHQPRYLDCGLSSLSEQLQRALVGMRPDWFASWEFAFYFCFPSAQRVWIREDHDGVLRHAFYYSEHPHFLGKRLTAFGPVELDMDEVHEILRLRNAACLSILCTSAANLKHSGILKGATRALYGEDIVVDMPSTVDQLLASLGTNKRQQLRKYTRRLERQWPGGVEWICLAKDEITRDLFGTVLALNSQRQSAKGKHTLWNDAMAEQRWQLASRAGLLCGIRIGHELVAGGVAYLYGQDGYFSLIGHNPSYDYWNLGNLTTWLMMQNAVNRGVRRFHFLWGISEYKFRFGGRTEPLYTVTVYRNGYTRLVASAADFPRTCAKLLLNAAQKGRIAARNTGVGQQIYHLLRRSRAAPQNRCPDGQDSFREGSGS
jgi:hypothetical protein